MEDINIGAITEALNDKCDRDMRNVDTTAKADAVIDYQLPTAENDYTWYRKYKSGWVEQGGQIPVNSTTINLPIEMSDTEYWAAVNYIKSTSTTTAQIQYISTNTQSKTAFTVATSASLRIWQVSGMAAN